jgi:hypothetical protein
MKKITLVLSLVLFGFIFINVSCAHAAAINTATNINVTPDTYHYTTFKGVPVYRLHITNSGDAPDTLVSLTPTPVGNVVDPLITLHFYKDANNNGIVDQGDTDLGASDHFASDNTMQTFTFPAPLAIPNGATTSILITADGGPAVGDAQIFNLSFALSTDILMGTVQITPAPGANMPNSSPLTVSNTAPSLSITNGANDPIAKTTMASETGVVVKQLSITAAATSDSIVSMAITPTGSENDIQVLSTKFYIDSETTPGVVDGSDILLATTPATYTGDNTKTTFAFLSPIEIVGNTTVNILYTYDLGAGVVGGNTLTSQLVATTDAVAGSGTIVSSNSSTVSSTITIAQSITINSASLVVFTDADSNGIVNIGDSIRIDANITNTDNIANGNCTTATPTVTADFTKYGGTASEPFFINNCNNGAGDTWFIVFTVSNAGGSGIDVGTANAASQVTVTAKDSGDLGGVTLVSNSMANPVDTIAPTITNVTATQHDATYKTGDHIDITVHFSENVYADSASQPTLTLNSSATPIHMIGGNGFNTWNFTYVVGAGDSATTLDYVDTNSFVLGGTTIKGNHGGVFFNDAILDLPAPGGVNSLSPRNIVIDAVAPTITGASSVTTPGTFGPTQNVDITLNFSENSSSAGGLSVTLNNGVIVNIAPFSSSMSASGTYLIGATGSGQDTNELDISSISGAIVDDLGNINSALSIPGGQNISDNTGTFVIDTTAPPISQINAMLQSSANPDHVTNNWYYYGPEELKFKVTTNEPLSIARACIRSITHEDPMNFCDPYGANYFLTGVSGDDYINSVGQVGNTYEFDQPLISLSHIPTNPGGYAVALYLVDAAGNVTISNSRSTSFGAVFGINPKESISQLNNVGTTDWSTITDFTNATNGGSNPLVFNVNNGLADIGRMSLTGTSLNLTDQATIDGLITFGSNVILGTDTSGVGYASLGINSTALTALNMPATLMIKVDNAIQPGLVVRNDTGTISGYIATNESGSVTIGSDDIDGFTWNAGAKTLTFNTSGFSSFGADNTAPTMTFTPTNGSTDTAITSGISVLFSEAVNPESFTYTLSPDPGGVSLTWNHNNDQVFINHNNLANGTTYTLSVTNIQDLVGNINTGSTSFSTTRKVRSGGSSGSSVYAIVTTPSPLAPIAPTISEIQKIIKDLKFGMSNSDVKILQLFLISQNKGLSAQALGVHGATNYFGKLTKASLAEWQKANGLKADGYFGPKTRAKMKELGL